MTIWPEWIASGDPFVIWGLVLSMAGGVMLIGIVLSEIKDTMPATPKRAIAGAIGIGLLILGVSCAIIGLLAMHGVPLQY
jgi:hypothetical protein